MYPAILPCTHYECILVLVGSVTLAIYDFVAVAVAAAAVVVRIVGELIYNIANLSYLFT